MAHQLSLSPKIRIARVFPRVVRSPPPTWISQPTSKYKDSLFSSPTDVGSYNPLLFGSQRLLWHSFLFLIDVGPPPPLGPATLLSFLPPINVGPHQIHPPLGPSVLAGTSPHVHPPPSGLMSTPLRDSVSLFVGTLHFDTICNGPPLANIVLFGAFPFTTPLKVFKTRLVGRDFHTLIESVSFSSTTDVESHNPPPFGVQCPRLHLFLYPFKWDPTK